MPEIDIPVLICGAGPTGLMAAFLLAKMGIPSRLIERDIEPTPLSRAIGIHARTIELIKLTDKKIFKDFGEQSWRSQSMQFYFGGSLTADIKPKPAKDSEFHVPWMLEQTRTVKILAEEYEATGLGKVERGWELMDTKVVEREVIEVAADGTTKTNTKSWVETTMRKAVEGTNSRKGESVVLGTIDVAEEDAEKQYHVKVVRSEYLIASDGGRSTVRHLLKVPFPGRTRDYNLILFDGCVETNLSTSNISFIHGDNRHSIGMFPIRDNRVRMMLDDGIMTQEQFNNREHKIPDKEYFEKRVAEALGDKIQLKILSYNYVTYYRVNERRAAEFAHKRRIFLAGDAAHCHSPAGGQGMNCGLQDSYNLAWKIALVLNGTAPQSLLDSYSEERIPIADEIIAFSAKTLDSGLYQGYINSKIKRLMLTIMPYISRYLPTNTRPPFSMLGLRYHENSFNKAHKTQIYPSTGPATVGERGPDDVLVPLACKSSTTPSPTLHASNPLDDIEGETSDQEEDIVSTRSTTTTTSTTTIDTADVADNITTSTETRLYELLAIPGALHIVVFVADRLIQEKGFKEQLVNDIDHYHRIWSSRWPGLGNILTPSSKWEAEMTGAIKKTRSTPQFVIHVITTVTPTDSDQLKELANRTVGFGKVYLDTVEGGRLHQRYGFASAKGSVEAGGGLVVLRPDTHIAYRVSHVGSEAWADVDEYFRSVLSS
ncbi:hypothetical protein FBU30_003127 [Linnemannia zychae]|nr:hypothetical protein FBU30_003127 [Linnemannia zychae]